MAIRYKGDIISRLKAIGYNTTRIRKENIFGQKTMQDFRTNAEIPYKTINKLCEMLHCQPGDILEFVPNANEVQEPTSTTLLLSEREQKYAQRLQKKLSDQQDADK